MNRLLTHIRLPSPIQYSEAATIQDTIVRSLLDRKQINPLAHLDPLVLTMQMSPVYTTGRRERGQMTHEERVRLQDSGRAGVVESLRGGQTTFHGPGQLVAYPILDLSRSGLNVRPRCYVDLLEDSIVDTLARFGVSGKRTEHTGVWVTQDRKIAAIGVHLRRNISSHGIALNVDTDLSYFDKIVACGLADKETTSMRRERSGVSVDEVTNVFVDILAKKLHLDGVKEKDLELDVNATR